MEGLGLSLRLQLVFLLGRRFKCKAGLRPVCFDCLTLAENGQFLTDNCDLPAKPGSYQGA